MLVKANSPHSETNEDEVAVINTRAKISEDLTNSFGTVNQKFQAELSDDSFASPNLPIKSPYDKLRSNLTEKSKLDSKSSGNSSSAALSPLKKTNIKIFESPTLMLKPLPGFMHNGPR